MQTPGPFDLPAPEAEAAAHSERLVHHIRRQIEAEGGSISFARYMELALYAPALGYYSAGSRKFGAGGDFVTAPELSPLFGACLARQIGDLLAADPSGLILEFGAGSGVLAATLLASLERLGRLPDEYLILELSGELRARQRQTLAARVPALAGRVRWLDTLPTGFRGIMLANEVLDAIPCERFSIRAGRPRQLRVVATEQGFATHEGQELKAATGVVQRCGLAELDGYCSEVNPRAQAWIHALGDALAQGVLLLIDYGYPQTEYYLPDRQQGTLRCYYRHRAHDEPFLYPGLCDITAHVDFTAIAEAGLAAGLLVPGFTTQGNFLIGCGLEEVARELQADSDPDSAAGRQLALQLASQIRHLTLPGEMGEAFKVLALTRGIDGPLRGFAFNDQRRRLGGS